MQASDGNSKNARRLLECPRMTDAQLNISRCPLQRTLTVAVQHANAAAEAEQFYTSCCCSLDDHHDPGDLEHVRC